MRIIDALLGRPLASSEDQEQRVGVFAGIPMLGLDALGSASYGPEAAMTVLLPLGALGLAYALPITLVILVILAVLFVSYRQTIQAYPNGGGSYTVATENLGRTAGLYAASALCVDYILNAAVGISAGIGALISAAPSLHGHILSLCLGVLALITIVNLRGVRESGVAWAIPTYLFVGTLVATIVVGLFRAISSGGHPVAVIAPPLQQQPVSPATDWLLVWLLVKAFASGCTAMTGVEAVSNGVGAFARPTVRHAHRTLAAIVGILAVLLLGIVVLCRFYGIGATDPDSVKYQSIISQLAGAVWGHNVMYYVTLGSVLAVLALSANTSFADFPRLCRLLALDKFLPSSFSSRGRRLVFTIGISVLAALSAVLLILFGGVTDRLIPLFAVGAFLAFTLSQAGMVIHWRKHAGGHSGSHRLVNLTGAIATGAALVVITVAKFAEGAWVTVILIPGLVLLFRQVRKHYDGLAQEVENCGAVEMSDLAPPVVVVPLRAWTTLSAKAIQIGMRMSPDVYAVHILADEEKTPALALHWAELVEAPALAAGRRPPELRLIRSPFRRLFGPLHDFVQQVQKSHPHRYVAVIVPDLQEARWYQYVLHNQRAQWLKASLMLRGNRRTIVVTVPWYLNSEVSPDDACPAVTTDPPQRSQPSSKGRASSK